MTQPLREEANSGGTAADEVFLKLFRSSLDNSSQEGNLEGLIAKAPAAELVSSGALGDANVLISVQCRLAAQKSGRVAMPATRPLLA